MKGFHPDGSKSSSNNKALIVQSPENDGEFEPSGVRLALPEQPHLERRAAKVFHQE